ncbi:MAG: HD domain-containing protein [Gemmatimonadetes bacterium]|nr:HD domain-containing protein [Gemmatimonadota bacterium]
MPSRAEAVQLLEEWVDNPALRNHMYAVEAAVRSYARRMDADEDTWGLAGLLHDLDWERHPDEHPLRAVEALRACGCEDEVLHAILAHRADFTGVHPETQLDRVLLACDELTGLINATALVRPTGIDDLTPKSVKKKMKDPTFAKGVSREDVRQGVELLAIDMDAHIQNVIDAMRSIGEQLGITGRQVSGAS